MVGLAILMSFVVYIVTAIIVESEICRPIREWASRIRKVPHVPINARWSGPGFQHEEAYCEVCKAHGVRSAVSQEFIWDNGHDCQVKRTPKLEYLLGCHLCTGTWVGLAVGATYPLPLHTNPVVSRLLSGLVYKGVAHFTLAVVNRLDRK